MATPKGTGASSWSYDGVLSVVTIYCAECGKRACVTDPDEFLGDLSVRAEDSGAEEVPEPVRTVPADWDAWFILFERYWGLIADEDFHCNGDKQVAYVMLRRAAMHVVGAEYEYR
jgi:hypothetical protein